MTAKDIDLFEKWYWDLLYWTMEFHDEGRAGGCRLYTKMMCGGEVALIGYRSEMPSDTMLITIVREEGRIALGDLVKDMVDALGQKRVAQAEFDLGTPDEFWSDLGLLLSQESATGLAREATKLGIWGARGRR